MDPDRMAKPGHSLRVKITRRKKWARIGIFNPTEPHSPRDAGCLLTP